MDKLSINHIIDHFFPGRSAQELWITCRSQMLWEAIRKNDAEIISISDLPYLLCDEVSVIIAPEPLPAMYLGIEPAHKFIDTDEIINSVFNYIDTPLVKCKSILETEPLYIFPINYSWMIALTTENTQEGKRLCVLVKGKTL